MFSRDYYDNFAVEDFNLEVKMGETIGLLGANGAGKTTLIKMMAGIVSPSSGEISVLGYNPFKRPKEFKMQVALVMGQKTQLWWDIPALDSLKLFQHYYELPDKLFQYRLDKLCEMLQVGDLLKIHLRKLSLGERMKMELLACLLHEPKVVFLDEPTIGLDLVAQKNVRQFLLDYQQNTKACIVLTSHYMADVEKVCPRIVFIKNSRKEFDGPIEQFRSKAGNRKIVRFVFSKPVSTTEPIWQGLSANFAEDNCSVDLSLEQEVMRKISTHILQHFPVTDFHTEKASIEQSMLNRIEDKK